MQPLHLSGVCLRHERGGHQPSAHSHSMRPIGEESTLRHLTLPYSKQEIKWFLKCVYPLSIGRTFEDGVSDRMHVCSSFVLSFSQHLHSMEAKEHQGFQNIKCEENLFSPLIWLRIWNLRHRDIQAIGCDSVEVNRMRKMRTQTFSISLYPCFDSYFLKKREY